MDTAALIRRARQLSGLSTRELARRARTSQSALVRYETAKAVPTVAVLERIVAAAGFVLRVRLGVAEVDPDDADQIDRNVARSPQALLDETVGVVRQLAPIPRLVT